MSYIHYNSNPYRLEDSDCVVRAVSFVTNKTWDDTYIGLSVQGFVMKIPFVRNSVWGAYLRKHGFKRYTIPNTCPDCYSVREFCYDNPVGTYLLAVDSHVVAVKDGDYYDIFDSGNEIPLYYWVKEV